MRQVSGNNGNEHTFLIPPTHIFAEMTERIVPCHEKYCESSIYSDMENIYKDRLLSKF